jgi:hypothetical protein
MSETNGQKPEWLERLERVEASHVKLMTDHELFVRQYDIDREKDRIEQKERAAQYDADRERDRIEQKDRDRALDERIAVLVSAMGAVIGAKPPAEGGAQ